MHLLLGTRLFTRRCGHQSESPIALASDVINGTLDITTVLRRTDYAVRRTDYSVRNLVYAVHQDFQTHPFHFLPPNHCKCQKTELWEIPVRALALRSSTLASIRACKCLQAPGDRSTSAHTHASPRLIQWIHAYLEVGHRCVNGQIPSLPI